MEQVGKTALVFGPTGAVGKELIQILLDDQRYEKVLAFSRRVLEMEHPKLEVILDTLNDLGKFHDKIIGHDLFCCIGTTSKKAGSRDNFKKVDLEMPAKLAEIASSNGVPNFIAISSVGAGKPGRGFYLDVKTEMENQIIQHDFKKLSFVRPSLLLSKRDEFRFSEDAGKVVNSLLSWAMIGNLEKYKGISTKVVASAMIEILNLKQPNIVYESDELVRIASI
jgi:uncharacterized protein YbjT (DUF2867 family)